MFRYTTSVVVLCFLALNVTTIASGLNFVQLVSIRKNEDVKSNAADVALEKKLKKLLEVTADVTMNEVLALWDTYKVEYGKQYKTIDDEKIRLSNFVDNYMNVMLHNQNFQNGLVSFRLELNKFADMGTCGSCWAFSATGSLEGQNYRKTKRLVSLSEQNLIDCSGQYGNHGCEGGWMPYAFQYIIQNNGIDTEASYPYEEIQRICRFKRENVGATCTGFMFSIPSNETNLQIAVATIGPISVAIDASHRSFQFYKHGVYQEPACSSQLLNHGVLIVGYGVEDNQEYWLVKNSWGTNWGDNGYIKMARNKNNNCGIATAAVFPLV